MSAEMSKKIHRMGSRNYVADNADMVSLPALDAGIYDLNVDPTGQIYASATHDIVIPKKLYGEMPDRCRRILQTYQQRKNKNTGVVLYGDKGSGKTLLAKQIMLEGVKNNIPSILINNSIETDRVIGFINNLNGPKILMFDEFEKNYRSSVSQEEWLTLFDGTGGLNNLFILTTNSSDISTYLDNRPGRVFYKIGYQGLDPAVIREFVDENIKNNLWAHGEKIKNVACIFHKKINFDMLAAWVEEVNRYEESPLSALRYLNVNLVSDTIEMDVLVKINDVVWRDENVSFDPQVDIINLQSDDCEGSIEIRKSKDEEWGDYFINYSQCKVVQANYEKKFFVLEHQHSELGRIVIELKEKKQEAAHPLAALLDHLSY